MENYKMTNKDKMAVRQAIFHQIENIVVSVSDDNGYHSELKHIPLKDIRDYAEKLIGLYSK